MNSPKWIQSVGKENSGLFKCPKCYGGGWIQEDPFDWTTEKKCPICFGYGEIPKRILDKYNKLRNIYS